MKITIITGGSSGIGKAMAEVFGLKGEKIIITGRNINTLNQAVEELREKGIEIEGIVCDSASEIQNKELIDQVIKKYGRVDNLINNAGISMRSMFETVDLNVLKQVMDINFWGTVYATYYALPEIKKSKGSIIGISSIAGFRGLPVRTGYSASKFAMNGFLEALRTELLYSGVNVLTACPGFTASNIRNNSLNSEGKITGKTMREEEKMMSAEEVAQEIYSAYKKKKKTLILTNQGKLTIFLNKWINGLTDYLVYNTLKKEKNSPLK
ncbi:MAG: hypothetical protein RIR51_1640 [Bacteroidota bacterium]